jgi:threonine dehydratase
VDFEDSTEKAVAYSNEHGLPLLKSFDDATLLSGFATIGKEVLEANKKRAVDYVLVPAGGGGLASSVASVVKQISPSTKVVAVEPDNCKPYSSSILAGKLIPFERVSKFCNGSSVKNTSELAYHIGRTSVDGFVDVSEKKLAEMIIQLYSLGFICEPSGALSIAALDKMRHEIKGKNVVCILSGANIDLTKLDEVREIAAISKGIKNHYHIHLPNRTGAMYDLIAKCFKKTDIISVQYSQRFGKESSQLLLSVESVTQEDVEEYIEKMVEGKFSFENINEKEDLLDIFF